MKRRARLTTNVSRHGHAPPPSRCGARSRSNACRSGLLVRGERRSCLGTVAYPGRPHRLHCPWSPHYRQIVKRVSVGVGMLAVYAVTFFLGLSSFSHAFGECVERGDNVRTKLNEYRRAKGSYPETLEQIDSSLPCTRISGRTILSYKKTASGYELRFRDWLVEHIATEADSFMAHK